MSFPDKRRDAASPLEDAASPLEDAASPLEDAASSLFSPTFYVRLDGELFSRRNAA